MHLITTSTSSNSQKYLNIEFVFNFFSNVPYIPTCGAASNTRNCLLRFSSSSRIAATLPHLQDTQDRDDNLKSRTKEQNKYYETLPVTIIWSRPYCDYLIIEHPFISFHYQLMGTTNVINVVCVVK